MVNVGTVTAVKAVKESICVSTAPLSGLTVICSALVVL